MQIFCIRVIIALDEETMVRMGPWSAHGELDMGYHGPTMVRVLDHELTMVDHTGGWAYAFKSENGRDGQREVYIC